MAPQNGYRDSDDSDASALTPSPESPPPWNGDHHTGYENGRLGDDGAANLNYSNDWGRHNNQSSQQSTRIKQEIKEEQVDDDLVIVGGTSHHSPAPVRRKRGRPPKSLAPPGSKYDSDYDGGMPTFPSDNLRRTNRSNKFDDVMKDAPELNLSDDDANNVAIPAMGRGMGGMGRPRGRGGRPRGRGRGRGRGGSTAGIEQHPEYVAIPNSPAYTLLQTGRCYSNSKTPKPLSHTAYYAPWLALDNSSRCIACVSRQSDSGLCRFSGLRWFQDLSQTELTPEQALKRHDRSWTLRGDQPLDPASYVPQSAKLPPKSRRSELLNLASNSSFEALQKLTKGALPQVKNALMTALLQEKDHEDTNYGDPNAIGLGACPVARTLPHGDARTICDQCHTTVFLGSYICGGCCKELCLDCWECFEPAKCARSRNSGRMHSRRSFFFLTKAAPGEIKGLIDDIHNHTEDAFSEPEVEFTLFPSLAPRFDQADVQLSSFMAIWRKGGIPIVITGVNKKLELPWDPEYMVREWGREKSLLHDCHDPTGQTVEVSTVEEFFEGFDKSTYKNEKRSLKLKDWPPSSEFKTDFPELFKDFEKAVPFPEYTTRTGPMNLASWLPKNWCYPDLGPKMYMAYPAPDFVFSEYWDPEQQGQYERQIIGSTNLHLDITDAVNLLVYAAPSSSSSPELAKLPPGTAAIWHIFPPTASEIIREYLRKARPEYYSKISQIDPIHGQCFYINDKEISLLPKEAQPYTIYQKVGDAVFIPAGCAHQVRNVLSAIKIAVDFLSPENLEIGSEFIQEHRSLSLGTYKKEDVLQLWNCLYFAYRGLKALANDTFTGEEEEPGIPIVRPHGKLARPRSYTDLTPNTRESKKQKVTVRESSSKEMSATVDGLERALNATAPVLSISSRHIGNETARLMYCVQCKMQRYCVIVECGCSFCQTCIQATTQVCLGVGIQPAHCNLFWPWAFIRPLLDPDLRERMMEKFPDFCV